MGDTFPSPLCGVARRALALVGGVFFRIVLDAQELQEVLRMVTSIILQRNGEVPARAVAPKLEQCSIMPALKQLASRRRAFACALQGLGERRFRTPRIRFERLAAEV